MYSVGKYNMYFSRKMRKLDEYRFFSHFKLKLNALYKCYLFRQCGRSSEFRNYHLSLPVNHKVITYVIPEHTGFLQHEQHDECHMWCRICLSFRSTWDYPQFLVGSCCLFFSFICYIMCTIVCLFVFFSFLAMSVYFRFMSLTVPLVSFVLFYGKFCL